MAETSSTTIKLAPEMRDRLKALAEAKRRTPHWLMKEAIEGYVDKEEKRQSFLRDAVESWEDFERTGLHLTGNEVDEWMQKIINGKDAELPEPHK